MYKCESWRRVQVSGRSKASTPPSQLYNPHSRRQLLDTGARAPLDFQQFNFFPVRPILRAAQSLTASSCGCLSKHIATAAAVVQSLLHEPCSASISRHCVCDKKFHVVLSPAPLAPDPSDTIDDQGTTNSPYSLNSTKPSM